MSLEGVKAFMRGLRRDLLDVQATLEEQRAGALRELAADRVAALDGAGPSLGPNEQTRGAIQVVVNELLVALAMATEEDAAQLATARRNLQLVGDQLNARTGIAKTIADDALAEMHRRSDEEVRELEKARDQRLVDRDELFVAKLAQRNTQFKRYDSERELWPALFQQKAWAKASELAGQALDAVQAVLDILGFIDGPIPIGVVADLINAAVSLLRGRIVDAGINLASAIPFAGSAIKGGKIAAKLLGPVTTALKYADEALDLSAMASKTIRYANRAALDVARLLQPVGKLASNVPGFCEAGRALGKLGRFSDEFIDALGIACFVPGVGVYNCDEGVADSSAVNPWLLASCTVVVVGLGAVVEKEKRRRREMSSDDIDAIFERDSVLGDSGPEDASDREDHNEAADSKLAPCDSESFDAMCDRLFAEQDEWPVVDNDDPSVTHPRDLLDVTNGAGVVVSRPRVTRQAHSPVAPKKSKSQSVFGLSRASWLILFCTLCISGVAAYFGLQASYQPPPVPRTTPIEQIQLGDRIAGRNPIREQAELIEPDPKTWRAISLHMRKASGKSLWIDLLRPTEWFEDHQAAVGGTIFLSLAEMGAVGDAEVLSIGRCPPIKPGKGTVVTGRFKHEVDRDTKVIHLQLADQLEPTGVTDNHPYWSEDRQEFIAAGQLRAGELVDTAHGPKHVLSVTPIDHNGFLHNMETTEHVFRVGSLGTLVHNSCIHRHHTIPREIQKKLPPHLRTDIDIIGRRGLPNR